MGATSTSFVAACCASAAIVNVVNVVDDPRYDTEYVAHATHVVATRGGATSRAAVARALLGLFVCGAHGVAGRGREARSGTPGYARVLNGFSRGAHAVLTRTQLVRCLAGMVRHGRYFEGELALAQPPTCALYVPALDAAGKVRPSHTRVPGVPWYWIP